MKIVEHRPVVEFISKGWGFEKILTKSNNYSGKLLFFVKGKKNSLCYHKNIDKTIYIHSGKIRVYFSDNVSTLESELKQFGRARIFSEQNTVLSSGDSFYIPIHMAYMIIAQEDTIIFEFSARSNNSDSHVILKGD